MACDTCGKADAELEPVNDIFRTSDVQMICPKCKDAINKQIFKIRHSTSTLMKNLVKEYLSNLNKKWRSK
jgi:protein-arginine kinase activator protein McsA